MTSNSQVDAYTVTAGRSVAWPMIIAKIKENPYTGYGRQAMLRTGTATYLYENFGEIFPHPHNAYLEQLLDNGLIGFSIVMPFYALMLFYSVRLFLDRKSGTCSAAGGVAAALIIGLLISAMGSQTFYPREGWIGMWCAMMLMLRVRTERLRLKAAANSPSTVAVGADSQAPATPASAPQPKPGIGPLWPGLSPVVARTPAARPANALPATATTLAHGTTTASGRAIGPLWQGATAVVRSRPAVATPAAAAASTPVPVKAVGPARSTTLGTQRPAATASIPRSGWFGPPIISDPLVWEHA